jgi:predicted TIM-barrel fold metal-dependent hydrolase
MTATSTDAALVRAQVDHPIIDADGHFVEVGPLLQDEIITYLEEAAGPTLRDQFLANTARALDTSTALANRSDPAVREQWRAMPSWWGWQTHNLRDRATSHLPALLYERLDELGIDFTILYPSMALGYFEVTDVALSSALCRAVNRYNARVFAPYRDRCTVGAMVPMITPAQAIAEAEYAVRELGAKSLLISEHVKRPVGVDAYRLDNFGIDSEHDYDPFWAKCVELGVAPVVHSSLQSHRVTRSISSYVYNHIDGLSAAHESLCKALFLGGVTRRFPDLRVGFLEGGVAWACELFAGLVGHWEKRNRAEIWQLDPDRLDVDALMAYFERYGGDDVTARLDDIRAYFARPAAQPANVDEFAACEIEEPDDLRALFERSFYFGCEADDPLVAWAFREDVNPLGARMRPILGSDISHWDVPDMTEPVAEAYELVERHVITEDDFRDLTFVNPVLLHASGNPEFFTGTVCEGAATRLLEGERRSAGGAGA